MATKKSVAPEPEAGIRVYMKESEFRALLDELEKVDWNHPLRWRLKAKWSEHALQIEQKRAAAKKAARSK